MASFTMSLLQYLQKPMFRFSHWPMFTYKAAIFVDDELCPKISVHHQGIESQ